MPPITDLRTHDTRWTYWNGTFPALTRPHKLRWRRSLIDWDLLRQVLLRAGTVRQRVMLVTARRGMAIHSTSRQMQVGIWIFQLAESRESILIGHKAKPSGHKTRWKENFVWLSHGPPYPGLSKQAAVWCEPWLLRGRLKQQAYRTLLFCPVVFLLRTNDTKDRDKGNNDHLWEEMGQ